MVPERRPPDPEGPHLGTTATTSPEILRDDSDDIARDSSTAAATGSGAAEGGEAADGCSAASAPPCPPPRCGQVVTYPQKVI